MKSMTLQLLVFAVFMQVAFAFHLKTSVTPVARFAQKSLALASVSRPGEVSSEPVNPIQQSFATRSKFIAAVAAPLASYLVLMGVSQAANAADATATTPAAPAPEEKLDLGPPPKNFVLKYEYNADCAQVLAHMRYAVQMVKGDPNLATVAQNVKDEMTEFVSYYRRFNGINGKQSFSLLYTSVNVLAGHYTSYGVKFPVPEKRRKRLLQEYNDIEKNLRKGR